jgi:hypothetical protein
MKRESEQATGGVRIPSSVFADVIPLENSTEHRIMPTRVNKAMCCWREKSENFGAALGTEENFILLAS